jgi:hypothetical protein
MEPLRPGRTSIIAILIFLALSPLTVFAGGQREDPVDNARQLMAERRYNDAILVLTEAVRKDPDKFDQVEALMEEIRTIRDKYNALYAELIEVLNPPEGESLDEERAYDIIRSMEELDRDPNSAAVEAFAEMRASIVFAVNDRQFRQIMADALILLEQERYDEAIGLYLSGFGLHRELYLEKDYNQQVLDQVRLLRSLLENEAASFREELPEAASMHSGAMSALADENRIMLSQALGTLKDMMIGIDLRRSVVLQTAADIDAVRLEIQAEDESDVPYLSTLRVLARGRADAQQPEGIAGAIGRFRDSRYAELFSGIAALAEHHYQSGIAAYNEKDRDTADREFSIGADYAGLLETVIGFKTGGELPAAGDAPETVLSDLLLSRALELSTAWFSRLNILGSGLYAEKENWDQLDPPLLAERRERILELREAVGESAAPVEEFLAILGEYPDTASLQRAEALGEQLLRAAEELSSLTLDLERESVVRRGSILLDNLDQRLARLDETAAEAAAYIEGTPELVIEGAEPFTVRRPRLAARNLQSSAPELETLDLDIAALTGELREEPAPVSGHEPVQELIASGEAMRAAIRVLQLRSASLLTKADELNRQADITLAEGNLRLSEAEALLSSNSFEQARDKLEQAGSALALSLTFREDEAVRSSIDQRISSLADRIITEQNRLVVRQVRDLINRGRELFFQEKFIEAEQTFQRAQARWLQTNTEEEPEVNGWLERVRRALETTSGVELTVADPLYPEMTQMLNLARKDFIEGEQLFGAGNRDRAGEFFAEAERKIEYVKEPFPNNKAASILYLQILQYTQPEDFDTIFSSRFNTARRQIATAPEEAYRELKVLEAIRPGYSGMERAIYDAEIATGIRQPPPDRAKLARARELYRDADRIVQNDIRAQFPVAIAYLNEAINLDPDYDAAVVLKDRIQAGSGGAVTVVLSSVAQQQLKQAEDLFIAGRYFEASVVVEQLLQNPENRRNPRLIELQKRIEARL